MHPTPTRRRTRLSLGLAALGLATAALASGAPAAGGATHRTTIAVESPPPTPVSLSETGSTLLYPLFNAWAPAYEGAHHSVTVSTAGTGSGTGITEALGGTADIGASDAYLSPTEMAQDKQARNIPLAISAQFVAYNLPGLSAPLHLDAPVLASIYQGKVTKWNAPAIAALNKGVHLPATAIVPLHRSDSSGDTFLFTSYLSKGDPSGWGRTVSYGTTVNWPSVPGALGEEGNSGMLAGCQATPGCVAYIGISYAAKATQAHLSTASLKNAEGQYEQPTAEAVKAEAAGVAGHTPANGVVSMVDVKAAGGYPIVNYEYAIVRATQSDPAKAQALRSLLEWIISPAGGNDAKFLDPVQFQPLPGPVATASDHQIKGIK
jgi:phosphate transport system substrate-binding protein